MAAKERKILGIIVLFAAFLIASIGSLAITNLSILDTDPGTYVIAVMLMLFLFIFFSAKEDIEFKFRKKDVAVGIVIFLFYVIILSFLRVALSFQFLSYRIDALLFPLLLLSFITMIFGIDSIRKLYPVIIYSLFASPLLLLPILNLNGAFANLNAYLVYDVIKLLGAAATKAGLVISSPVGSSITISSTCVSLGIFAAFVMFLIPIAYVYDGKGINKVYWVISGIVLILALNFMRMLLVAVVWVYYGLNNAIGLFHSFAGELIFYIAIILMILLTYKYGMEMRKSKKKTATHSKESYTPITSKVLAAIVIVFALAAIALFFSLGYRTSIVAPVTLIGSASKTNPLTLEQYELNSLENANSNILILGNSPNGELFSLGNSSTNQSIFILVNASPGGLRNSNSLINLPSGLTEHYLLRNGITITSTVATSSNLTFDLNYFSIPYNTSSGWISLDYLLFKRVYSGTLPDCNAMADGAQLSTYIENRIYDAITFESNSGVGLMCQSYRIANSA